MIASILESAQKSDTHTNDDATMQDPVIPPAPPVPDTPSALSRWIENFFSDRPLAKI